MKIITLTLNPAFDVHCTVPSFKPYHENVAVVTSADAGGKGVNISRALTYNGIANTAVVIVGRENGASFLAQLQKDGIACIAVETDGRIRENYTVHSGDGADETRISFQGFTCEKRLLAEVKTAVGDVDEDTIITLTGSVPNGISVSDVKETLADWKRSGAKIVIDSRSFSADDLKDCQPWLIKPNRDEAETYTSCAVHSVEDGVAAAKGMYALGIENVMISLGGDGAVLVNKQGVFHAQTPNIRPISTIGAGDSSLAGFVGAYAGGGDSEDCLRRAVAYGTAACLQEGTRPPLPQTVNEIADKITVRRIS